MTEQLDNTPFKKLHDIANPLARSLTGGSRVVINTETRSGRQHRLVFSIKGRRAHIDAGSARPGYIVNFPTGEAYIAPNEDSVQGSIVINGSIPDTVLGRREIVTDFRDGYLVPAKIRGSGRERAQQFLVSLAKAAEKDHGSAYRLAEFGIGCNPAHKRFIGRQLADEKIPGTIHIGLGSNVLFGGTVTSDVHFDLVTTPTSVRVDKRLLKLPKKV